MNGRYRSSASVAKCRASGGLAIACLAPAPSAAPSLAHALFVTIQDAEAPASTLTAMLVVIAVGMALLLPSLWLLFRVFKARNPAAIIAGSGR